MKYDAFISYRRTNGFLMAQVILYRLKERGIRCFLDLEEDRSGEFDENLLSAIEDAPNFILVLPQNALDRCVDEKDWVRKEILAAVEAKKNIIPVIFDGFSWPKEWPEGMPVQIRQLAKKQHVSLSQEYLSAMIDKIVEYSKDLTPRPTEHIIAASAIPFFTEEALARDDTASIDLAFHAGAQWQDNQDLVKILAELLAKKHKLRVLVNEPKAVKRMCEFMRQPMKRYTKFNTSLADWLKLEKDYPEQVRVGILNIPLLRRAYIIHRADGTGVANIKFYSYGKDNQSRESIHCLTSADSDFHFYADEFDYLWSLSKHKTIRKNNQI